MHCRGSSRKQAINFNEKLMVFILHEEQLYSWVQFDQKDINHSNQFSQLGLRKVQTLSRSQCSLRIESDDCFYFKADSLANKDGNIAQEMIKQLTISFCNYEIITQYIDSDVNDTILAFDIDQETQKIMIICKSYGLMDHQAFYTFKIFDLESTEIEFSLLIENEELIGRLISGLYTFVSGHIYFNNNVIKIRYDLIKRYGSTGLIENNFFNTYFNIFPLESNMKVRSNTPLISLSISRFAYIIQDKEFRQPKMIKILPLLHERKVNLNLTPKNTNFYYTAIETQVKAEKLYNQKLRVQFYKQFENKISSDSSDDDYNSEDEQTDVEDDSKFESYSAIICMSIIQKKFDVYIQNGIKINQVDYSLIVSLYGEPCAVSTDGTKFIFKHTESKILDKHMKFQSEAKDEKYLIKDYMKFSILHLNVFGFTHIKDVCILSDMKNCLQEGRDASQPRLITFKTQNRWLFIRNFQEFKKYVSVELRINDNMDICAKIQQMSGLNQNEIDMYGDSNEELCALYYVQKCGLNLDQGQINDMKRNQPYNYELIQMLQKFRDQVDEKDEETGQAVNIMHRVYTQICHHAHKIQFNNKYLFILNNKEINYFNIHEDFEQRNRKKINLQIALDEEETCITQIRMSSNPNIIGIVLSEDEGSVIFKWNLKSNSEILMHDIQGKFKIIWDSLGEMYVLNQGYTFFTDLNCSIKSFKYQKFENMKTIGLGIGLGSERGVRMDSKNHNWMILEEYLAIPFSYMSFVIKNHIECVAPEQRPNFIFDQDSHDYLLNKSSSFLDGGLVKNDPAQLNHILQSLGQLDPNLLQILLYTQKVDVKINSAIYNKINQKKQAKKIPILSDLFRSSMKRVNQVKNLVDNQPIAEMIQITNSPLHMAIREGNNKSIECLLLYMSQTSTSNSIKFRDIFDQLIIFHNMKTYIENLPVQTNQMIKKQVLKMNESYSDQIICMTESNKIYVDSQFYHDSMNERLNDPTCSSYPVKVVALRCDWILKADDKIDGRYFLKEILKNQDLSYYNLKSLRMLIEFLYQKIKYSIIRLMLPCYLCNQVIFVVVALTNENLRSSYIIDREKNIVTGSKDSGYWEQFLITFCLLNLFFVLVQFLINYMMFKMMGIEFFYRFWTWIDILIFFNSITILVQFFLIFSKMDENGNFKQNYDDYMQETTILRIMLMVGQMILFSKSQQFLTLVDKIAPLINVVFQTFADIAGFIVILVLVMFSISFAFYIIAQNQVNFDDLSQEEVEQLGYNTMHGSFIYVGNILLGEPDSENFSSGKARMQIVLQILFWIACFIILIHLLNMLIAIMGNTFNVGNQTQEQQMYKEHLNFVIDNWFMRRLAFDDFSQVQYIITAFSAVDNEECDPAYLEIKEDIAHQTDSMSDKLKKHNSKIGEVQRMITKLLKKKDPDD